MASVILRTLYLGHLVNLGLEQGGRRLDHSNIPGGIQDAPQESNHNAQTNNQAHRQGQTQVV